VLVSDLGIEVEAVKGRGYRLRQPLEVLDAVRVRDLLDAGITQEIQEIAIHQSLDSTNTWLMQRAAEGALGGSVCIAERQTAGRGRHGRPWISPYGGRLYLSLLWRYQLPPAALGGLSLACGVAVARALERLGVADIGLKWPNDLLWGRRKLAGLLLEVRGEVSGPSLLVAGVGLNVRMPPQAAAQIEQPWVTLEQIPGLAPCPRNRLVALLIGELATALMDFTTEGLAPFLADWSRLDIFKGERIHLMSGQRRIEGEYLGISPDGALRLAINGAITCYSAGEVHLCRPVA